MASEFGPVFGYRDDIDLRQKWWHRLAQVIGALAALAVAAIAAVIWRADETWKPRYVDLEVITTLQDFVLKERSVPNHLRRFASLPGDVGQLNGIRVEPVWSSLEGDCMVFSAIESGGKKLEKPEEFAYCSSLASVSADRVIKYRYSAWGYWRVWIMAAAVGLTWATGISLVAMNLYYRGFVYIVCGPRRKKQDLEAV